MRINQIKIQDWHIKSSEIVGKSILKYTSKFDVHANLIYFSYFHVVFNHGGEIYIEYPSIDNKPDPQAQIDWDSIIIE